MKASVVVTTYNSPEYLKRVLGSFTSQTVYPRELIVADDGSGEDTRKVVDGFASKAPFEVRHVWHEDEGFRLARIRNLAIKEAKGEYLVIMDGDCVVSRHFVSDHLRLAARGYFVQGKRMMLSRDASAAFTHHDANSTIRLMGLAVRGGIGNSHHIFRLPWLPPLSTTKMRGVKGCNMAFFREDLIAVNGYNEAFMGWGREDSEIAVRLYRYGLKRREHPFMACCFHLWHPEAPRGSLEENDRILDDTLTGTGYRCQRGIGEG